MALHNQMAASQRTRHMCQTIWQKASASERSFHCAPRILLLPPGFIAPAPKQAFVVATTRHTLIFPAWVLVSVYGFLIPHA